MDLDCNRGVITAPAMPPNQKCKQIMLRNLLQYLLTHRRRSAWQRLNFWRHWRRYAPTGGVQWLSWRTKAQINRAVGNIRLLSQRSPGLQVLCAPLGLSHVGIPMHFRQFCLTRTMKVYCDPGSLYRKRGIFAMPTVNDQPFLFLQSFHEVVIFVANHQASTKINRSIYFVSKSHHNPMERKTGNGEEKESFGKRKR